MEPIKDRFEAIISKKFAFGSEGLDDEMDEMMDDLSDDVREDAE